MTKTKRDYCLKGRHPNWRWWKSRYDMKTWKWEWLGEFCESCGKKIETAKV